MKVQPAGVLEFRLMRELTFLIAAANKETDLRKRMERLQHAGAVLESIFRIAPELDASFWYSSLQRELDACQEQIDDLYDDDWQGPALLRLSTLLNVTSSSQHHGCFSSQSFWKARIGAQRVTDR